jgi:hypothetical protein
VGVLRKFGSWDPIHPMPCNMQHDALSMHCMHCALYVQKHPGRKQNKSKMSRERESMMHAMDYTRLDRVF